MSYDAKAAADTFYDKWLPAFSEPMLGYAERFHKEITAALLEAHAAGIKVSEKCQECGGEEFVLSGRGEIQSDGSYEPEMIPCPKCNGSDKESK